MKELIKEKIEEIQGNITELVDLIYQKKEQEAYQKIDTLLQLLLEVSNLAATAVQQGEAVSFEEEPFKNGLLEAMKAMEAKDLVLFADILQYEIGEQLQGWIE